MGWVSNLFGRRGYRVLEGSGKATDDWQAGDLALCIATGPWIDIRTYETEETIPTKGMLYLVDDVTMIHGYHAIRLPSLGTDYWSTRGFIKVPPESQQDEYEEPKKITNPVKDPVKEDA